MNDRTIMNLEKYASGLLDCPTKPNQLSAYEDGTVNRKLLSRWFARDRIVKTLEGVQDFIIIALCLG